MNEINDDFISVQAIAQPQNQQQGQTQQQVGQNDPYLSSNFTPQLDNNTQQNANSQDEPVNRFNENQYKLDDAVELIKNNQRLKEQGNVWEYAESEAYFRPTNIAYLDEKLKKGTITGWDALAAQKYYGINLAEYGNQKHAIDLKAKINAKVKGLGLTELNKELRMYANNDELFNRAIIGSEDNLGIGSAVERGLHRVTGGWKDLDKGESQWIVDVSEAANALARARIGGQRTTDKMREQASSDLAIGLKSENTFMGNINSAKKTNLVAWATAIRNAQEHGLPVNDEDLEAFARACESVMDLDEALKGTWDKKNYANYRQKYNYNYGGKAQPQEQGTYRKVQNLPTQRD